MFVSFCVSTERPRITCSGSGGLAGRVSRTGHANFFLLHFKRLGAQRLVKSRSWNSRSRTAHYYARKLPWPFPQNGPVSPALDLAAWPGGCPARGTLIFFFCTLKGSGHKGWSSPEAETRAAEPLTTMLENYRGRFLNSSSYNHARNFTEKKDQLHVQGEMQSQVSIEMQTRHSTSLSLRPSTCARVLAEFHGFDFTTNRTKHTLCLELLCLSHFAFHTCVDISTRRMLCNRTAASKVFGKGFADECYKYFWTVATPDTFQVCPLVVGVC